MASEQDEFEWDEGKRASNLTKHRVNFEDARTIWRGPVMTRSSSRGAENRYASVGELHGQLVVVNWTWREDRRRLISARRAGYGEREDYAAFLERSASRPH